MDYEKMYKAVLKTVKQWIEDGCSDKEKICLESIFPELRESEDERIIVRLIEYFQGFLEGYEDCYKDGGCVKWEGLDVKSILAWLEKQKENADSFTDGVIEVRSFQRGMEEGRRLERQKDASKAQEAVDRIDKYIDEHVANAHDMKDSNPDKKYYRGWDDALGKMSGILQDVYSEKENKFAPRVLPCSAAWFEDDDEKQKEQKVDIDKLRRDLYQSGDNDGYQHGKEDAQKEHFRYDTKMVEQEPIDYEAELKKCKDNPLYFYDKYVSIKQKPVEYLSKDKVYAIMSKLTKLSTSNLIPFNSPEYKKINEITSDVRSLLDYPIEQKPNIEICPHSIKSKSYKENGYPIEDCDYGLEIAKDILEKTLGKVEGYQSDDGIREHQTAIQAVKDAMKEQKPSCWNSPVMTHEMIMDEQKPDSLIYDKDLDKAAREFYLSGGADSPVDSTGLVPIVRMAEFGATWMKKKMEKEQRPAEWSEDWREEDIQTRFAFYTYKDDSSVLYLSNVFVEETSRNHGFGTRILRAAEKVAETIGATTISLKVKQDSPANAWYRKNGYGYVAFEDGYDWLEKNLEYMKPNKQEWSEEDEKTINLVIETLEHEKYLILAERLKSLKPKPKQEWSEEDEEMLNSCISSIEESKENRYAYKETDGDTSYDHEIAWLKSLPERFNLQSKQETHDYFTPHKEFFQWIYDRLVHVHKENPDVDYMMSFKKRINNLSFEDKPRWKPSEAQLMALHSVIDDKSDTIGNEQLKLLYNDLKKLM